MPIKSIDSYVETALEVIAHWKSVNAERLASALSELLLKDGYGVADLIADQDLLEQKIIAVGGWRQERVLAVNDRNSIKQNLLDRLRQFRSAVCLHLQGTSYDRAAPTIPQSGRAESKFLRPLINMADLWEQINAATDIAGFTPPLVLRGGYTLAAFLGDLQATRDAFAAVADAENGQQMARRQRDELLDPLRNRMLQYRAGIKLEYGPGHPFYDSLPRISRRNRTPKRGEIEPMQP